MRLANRLVINKEDCRNQPAGSVHLPDNTGHKYPLPVYSV